VCSSDLELAIAKYGAASLDVAAITSTDIYGIEIKGDGDSTSRLQRQGWVYSRCASHMWLLPAPSLEKAAIKHRPVDWIMLNVRDGVISGNRASSCRLPNAAASLLDILWKTELLEFAKSKGLDVTPRMRSDQIAEYVSERIPLSQIRTETCRRLLARDWATPPYTKKVYRPGDALPEMTERNG